MKKFPMFILGFALSITMSIGLVTALTDQSLMAQDSFELQEVSVTEENVSEDIKPIVHFCKDSEGAQRQCTNDDLFQVAVSSIGGFKGATTLGIVYIVVNFLMIFLYSPLGNRYLPKLFKSKSEDTQKALRLSLAIFLYLVLGVVGLMLPPNELSLFAALTHSSTLSIVGIAFNQIGKRYVKDPILNS